MLCQCLAISASAKLAHDAAELVADVSDATTPVGDELLFFTGCTRNQHVRKALVVKRLDLIAEPVRAAHRCDDQSAHSEVSEATDLLFLAIDSVCARREQKSVSQSVRTLLGGVGNEGEERTAEVAKNEA